MHIVRINGGLRSAEQVPLLLTTLQVYRQAGDWQALDDNYDYYFHLLGSGQGPLTPLRLESALAYMRWQREALRLDVGSNADPVSLQIISGSLD